MFFIFVCPLAGDFADARDGDGGGEHLGRCWIHFKIILIQFWINFRTMLGPPMPANYAFQQKNNFLEMAHTNVVSSIR